jgi:hypothetical protein
MSYRRFFFYLLSAGALLSLSCSEQYFSAFDEVAFTIPSAVQDNGNVLSGNDVQQANGQSEQAWHISYVDENNVLQEITVPYTEEDGTVSFTITLCKNFATPVLAWRPAREKPLGTIYPYKTTLTFEDGFAADILRTLYAGAEKSGTDGKAATTPQSALQVKEFLSKFNWSRFMEACTTYEDAWLLDRARILEKIATGTFKESDMVLCKTTE